MREFYPQSNGCITPEMHAEFLSKNGHLEGIVDNVKYFTFNGYGFKVIYANRQAVQVNKIPAEDIKTILSCKNLKFGGF